MPPAYRIFETRQFEKDLSRLARAGREALVRKLHEVVYPQLRQNPHFGPHGRKLKGLSPPTWRYRIGAWRFFYEIDEDTLVIALTAAAHRGSVY